MIEPVRMKPQSLNFGTSVPVAKPDPLNARASYAKVLNDNKGILAQEAIKIDSQVRKEGVLDIKA